MQFIMSGGTEGIMTPHVSVFVRREFAAGGRPGKGLVAGIASTRAIEPEELGTTAHVREVALAVRAGMRDAGITDVADVHFVQIKCPLLTAAAITEATAAGKRVATTEHLRIDGLLARGRRARGGAGARRGPGRPLDRRCHRPRWDLFSRVASTSAGVSCATTRSSSSATPKARRATSSSPTT